MKYFGTFSNAPGGRPSRFSGSGVVHVDAALSTISIGYSQAAEDFIADRVMPRVPVEKQSDKYFVWGREAFEAETLVGNTVESLLREPGTEYKRIEMTPATDSYNAYQYGAEMALDDIERANADAGADVMVAYTGNLTQRMMLEREARVAAIMGSSTYLTNYTTVTTTSQWSDVTSGVSDPIANVDTWKENVRLACGRNPNQMVMGAQVWSNLRRHSTMVERFKYTRGGVITLAQAAEIFEIPTILVGNAHYNTYEKGLTYTPGYVWGKKVVVQYVPPAPSRYTPATAYQFVFQDQRVSTRRDDGIDSDIYRVSEVVAEKLVSAYCAYLALTVVA